MTEPKRRYFVVENADTDSLRAMVEKQRVEYRARRAALQTKYGASAMLVGNRDLRLSEFLFDTDGPFPDGTRATGKHYEDGKVYYRCRPHLTKKTGKAIWAEMCAVGGFNAGKLILGHFGIKRTVYAENAMWIATAGIVKDQVVIQVPESDEDLYNPPESFKELKKSEWIALTEE
ncbi:MAG: hypothetical protein ACRYGK_01610 [Janthinobacterium lividum]